MSHGVTRPGVMGVGLPMEIGGGTLLRSVPALDDDGKVGESRVDEAVRDFEP